MATDINEGYNTFEQFPLISSNMVTYMMENNELIWKLLAYNDPDAYKTDSAHPNLTMSQKGKLIYNGVRSASACRIFFDAGLDDGWVLESCIMRFTPIKLIPVNRTLGNVIVGVETYCHSKINHMTNQQTRLNMITQQVIQTFNGTLVGGLGQIYFNAQSNRECQMYVGGQIPFRANIIKFCNWSQ